MADQAPGEPGERGSDRPERHTLFMMDHVREGVWEVPEVLELRGTRTKMRLDLTEATFAAPEVTIAFGLYNGSATVIVGPDVEVLTSSKKIVVPESLGELGEDTQVVMVRGYARLFGKIEVTRA